jgi:hypothetical protein
MFTPLEVACDFLMGLARGKVDIPPDVFLKVIRGSE